MQLQTAHEEQQKTLHDLQVTHVKVLRLRALSCGLSAKKIVSRSFSHSCFTVSSFVFDLLFDFTGKIFDFVSGFLS